MKKLILIFIFILFSSNAWAATYYVTEDGASGHDGTTYANSESLAHFNGGSFGELDDDTVYFCDTIRGTVIIPDSGSLGHPATFRGDYPDHAGIISGADAGAVTTPVRQRCIQVGASYDVNYQYLTFDGLTLEYPTQYGIGQIDDIDNAGIIIQNCTFTAAAIFLQGADILIQDNTMTGPTGTAVTGAIFLQRAWTTDPQVLRNTISGYANRGIHLEKGVHNPTVNYNNVGPITGAEGYGINFDGYSALITGTVTAIGNIIHDVTGGTGWGIFLENCTSGSYISGNRIYNCTGSGAPTADEGAGIFYMNYPAGFDYGDQRGVNVGGVVTANIIYGCNRGVGVDDTDGVDIWNNTIDDGVNQTPKGIALSGSVAAYFGDIDIRNNIFGSGFTYVVTLPEDSWESCIVAFDYNRFEDITVMNERSGANHSFATLQGESKALNCFTTAPGFVNDSGNDYTLTSIAACKGTGEDLGNDKEYGLDPTTKWSYSVKLVNQDLYGAWEIGGFVYIEAAELGGPGTIPGGGLGKIAGGGLGSIIGTAP